MKLKVICHRIQPRYLDDYELYKSVLQTGRKQQFNQYNPGDMLGITYENLCLLFLVLQDASLQQTP